MPCTANLQVVAPDKQPQAGLMQQIGFREGQGLAHQTTEPLPQRVIQALDMGRLAGVFTYRAVLTRRNDLLVRLPEIGVTDAAPIGTWNTPPQPPTGCFRTVTHGVPYHLAS